MTKFIALNTQTRALPARPPKGLAAVVEYR